MESKNKPHAKGTKSLFKNKFLERLTRTHISAPLIMFSTASTILMIYGLDRSYISALNAVPWFLVGLVAFTLVEYIMHRFLFHLAPTNEKREKFAYAVHGVHHDYPKDKDRLAMPIPMAIVVATAFYFLFRLILGNSVYGFLPGFYMGYATYLWIHYMVHAFQPPKNFWKVLWVHHGIHHYKDPESAFGVSSSLWDMVFGTMPKK
ncbi:MAG: sterol desaturase family protein [Cyclobacteriaceae bacterium]